MIIKSCKDIRITSDNNLKIHSMNKLYLILQRTFFNKIHKQHPYIAACYHLSRKKYLLTDSFRERVGVRLDTSLQTWKRGNYLWPTPTALQLPRQLRRAKSYITLSTKKRLFWKYCVYRYWMLFLRYSLHWIWKNVIF